MAKEKIKAKYSIHLSDVNIDLEDYGHDESATWESLNEMEQGRITDTLRDMAMDNNPIWVDIEIN